MTAEAVQWLEREFDSRRIQGMAGYEYEPPQTAFYGYTQPMLYVVPDPCEGFCPWFVALNPQPGASVMLLGLPWGVEREREWLDYGWFREDADYRQRYSIYQNKTGKEHT